MYNTTKQMTDVHKCFWGNKKMTDHDVHKVFKG